MTLQALSLVEKVELVQVCFTLRLRDQRIRWMQDGCEVYMDSYMASTGSCFMVTWTIFKNHLLEVDLTQNRETMSLRTLTTVDLIYYVWGPAWIEIHQNSLWLRARSHMASQYTWGSMTTLHDVGGVLGRPLDTFFWARTISWSRLLARVWSGPKSIQEKMANPGARWFFGGAPPKSVIGFKHLFINSCIQAVLLHSHTKVTWNELGIRFSMLGT